MNERARWMCFALVLAGCGPRAGESVASADTSTSTGTPSSSASTGTAMPSTSSESGETASAEPTTATTVETSLDDDGSTGTPVSSCETPPDLPPECWDHVCEQFLCGEAASYYDAEGCPRADCSEQADCSATSTCTANVLASPCTGGQVGWYPCEVRGGQCVCGGSLGCGPSPRGFCIDTDEIDFDAVCRATAFDCTDYPLMDLVGQTHAALTEIDAELSDALREQARGCQSLRVARALDECASTACEQLCIAVSDWGGCGLDCSACDGAQPEQASAVLGAFVDRPLLCPDCALCEELDSELCAALVGC